LVLEESIRSNSCNDTFSNFIRINFSQPSSRECLRCDGNRSGGNCIYYGIDSMPSDDMMFANLVILHWCLWPLFVLVGSSC
jgi:hypothetical protein